MPVGPGDLDPVEAVHLGQPDMGLEVFHLGGDHVKGLVKVKGQRGMKIR